MTDVFITRGYPLLCAGLLAAWAAAVAILARRRSAAGWAAPAAVAAAALALLGLFPSAHYVIWDEIEHLHYASNIRTLGAYAQAVVLGPDGATLTAPNHWPPAFHVLAAAAGGGERAAFLLNRVFGAAAAGVVFALARALFGGRAAFFAAAALALSPLHLKYALSGDLTAASFFWTAAAALAFVAWRPGDRLLSAVFWLTTALAVHTRPENLVLLALFPPLLVRRGAPAAATAALTAASAAPLLLLIFAHRSYAASHFAAAHWLANAPGNVLFLFDHTPVLLAAGLAGMALAPAPHRLWLGGLLLLHAGLCWSDFSIRFAVWSQERFALPLFLPLALGTGLALSRLRPAAAAALLAAAVAVPWRHAEALFTVPDSQVRQERLLRDARALLPQAYVVSFSVPAVAELVGRPAVSVESYLLEPGRFGEVVYFQDFWRWSRPEDDVRLRAALPRLEPLLVREIDDRRFGFYRVR